MDKNYICKECALKCGGAWPDGHVASSFFAMCQYCYDYKCVCHVTDWLWVKDATKQRNEKREKL